MKTCNKCGVEKPLEDFYFLKSKNKYDTICKQCIREKNRKYYSQHKDYFKEYMNNNSYKYINTFKESSKKYYEHNKEKYQNKQREYYNKNKDIVKEYNKNYKNNKKHNNSVYKKQCYISGKIREVFNKKGNCNCYSVEFITGISCKELYNYLINSTFAKIQNGLGEDITMMPNPTFVYQMPKE